MTIGDLLLLRFLQGRLRTACYAMGGMTFGLGCAVAAISNAASYLSDDPKACINCHIMNPEYASWQHSSHGRVTVCNDCHVPHGNLAAKLFYKAKDGSRHSLLYTLRRENQVIQAIPGSKKVIQQNCLRCHRNAVAGAVAPVHQSFERSCTDCHREVPHGRVHSLSSAPNAAVPPLSPVTPNWMKKLSSGEVDK